MKIAVIGSRGLAVADLGRFLPAGVTEIVSGGARGIDACARAFARGQGLKLTEFLPEYERFGRGAPLRRNLQIIDYADMVIAFWDGKSAGTRFVIEQCRKKNKKITVYRREGEHDGQNVFAEI